MNIKLDEETQESDGSRMGKNEQVVSISRLKAEDGMKSQYADDDVNTRSLKMKKEIQESVENTINNASMSTTNGMQREKIRE